MYNQEIITRSISTPGGSTNATDGIALMFAGMGAFMGVIIVAILIGFILGYVIYAIILGKIFKKAGIKPSIAWIPVYSNWKLLEMGDQKGFWAIFVFFFAPVTSVFTLIAMYHIGKKFGKEDWFFALAILVLPAWLLILAFDKSVWNATAAPTTAPAMAPPEQPTNIENNISSPITPSVDQVAPVMPVPVAENIAPLAQNTEIPTPPVVQYSENPETTLPEVDMSFAASPNNEFTTPTSPEAVVPVPEASPEYNENSALNQIEIPVPEMIVPPETPVNPEFNNQPTENSFENNETPQQ